MQSTESYAILSSWPKPIKFLGASVLITSILLFTACSKQPQKQPPAPAVTTAIATIEEIHPVHTVVGRTAANENVNISSRVTGYLQKRLFREGQQVQQGQLLYQIDPAPYQEEVANSEALLKHNEAAAHVDLLNYNRGKKLIKSGAISQSDMDRLTAKKLQSSAQVKSAKSQLETAQIDLGYTKIFAPLTGVIGRSDASIGDLIKANQDVMANLVSINPIYAYFDVSENQFLQYNKDSSVLRANDTTPPVSVTLKLSDGSLYDEKGTIDFVNNKVNSNTGTIEARASFPNPNRTLLPGQYVTVILEEAKVQKAILIPQTAIQKDQRGDFVLLVDKSNIAQVQIVKTGPSIGRDITIIKGLKAGDQVITEGIQKVRPGKKVNPAVDTTPDKNLAPTANSSGEVIKQKSSAPAKP